MPSKFQCMDCDKAIVTHEDQMAHFDDSLCAACQKKMMEDMQLIQEQETYAHAAF